MAARRLLVCFAAGIATTAAKRAPSLEAWINDLELVIDEKISQKIAGINVKVKDIECEDLELGSLTAEFQPGDAGCRTDKCTDAGQDCCAPLFEQCSTDMCTDAGEDCCAPTVTKCRTDICKDPGGDCCAPIFAPPRAPEARGCSVDGWTVTPGGLLHCILVAVLWAVPLNPQQQKGFLAWAEWAYGWAALDVFLVALLATAIQLPQLVKMLIKSPCKEVDGALAAFFENALEGDTTCFRLAVRLQPGCTYLAFAAVLHMIFGALAAHNGNTAVAERVAADPGPTPARRGSDFEPVEAEEAKEGDEDEKKGLSMWENISAQVKGAFPAAEKAEAPEPPAEAEPIHAKTEV